MKFLLVLKIVLVLVLTTAVSRVWGQTPVPDSEMTQDQQTQFEDTNLIKAESDFFGVRFSLNGQEINGDQELEKIIASADDEKAVQYLKESADHRSLGWILIGSGSGLMVVGAFSNWNNSNTVLFNVLVLGGLATDMLGGMLYREAQMEQFNAVDRYNQIIRQDNGLSFLNLPTAPMGLAYVQRF